MLPWHFMKGFVIREKDFLDDGSKFIAPLPVVSVIGANGYKKIIE